MDILIIRIKIYKEQAVKVETVVNVFYTQECHTLELRCCCKTGLFPFNNVSIISPFSTDLYIKYGVKWSNALQRLCVRVLLYGYKVLQG